jgi:hypothetical protein
LRYSTPNAHDFFCFFENDIYFLENDMIFSKSPRTYVQIS